MTARAIDIGLLYAREHGRLRAFVRRIVNNHSAAEDVVQQAFSSILGRPANADAVNAAYVTQAVHNLALNYLRDTRRRAQIEISGLDTQAIADTAPSPETVVIYRHALRRILEAIAALPPRQREAFVLKRIEGLSYDEISRRMGTTRNTVISQVAAALASLDTRLA
jgi:RNA polymerase sigma-70 factor (ECF subfamily)